jgi:hypothetical protein
MLTLSVKQPHALLICEGIKPIENRSWKLPEKYKGERVLIHASMKPDKIRFEVPGEASCMKIMQSAALNRAEEDNLFGCIIGSVRIVDCVQHHISEWAIPFYWHWMLKYAILFPKPIPAKGRLGFWDFDLPEEYKQLIP